MNRRFVITAGAGCLTLILLVAVGIAAFAFLPFQIVRTETQAEATTVPTLAPGLEATQEAVPTLPRAQESEAEAAPTLPPAQNGQGEAVSFQPPGPEALTALYDQLNPGVVSIQVYTGQGFGGVGGGSGFILNEEGRIVTNNHVVAQAQEITVVFHNGFEADAEVIGTDDDSDLAVIQVDQVPEEAHPLPLGDSDAVQAGDWVIAIGNPFSLGGSMSLGIVSAVGRSIPSGVTPFAIPQSIQTDAAINPGNSGGPLLNLEGEVVGVNAQIRTTGTTPANSGVGFAIPVNVVRRVAPVLIEQGQYQWPWLGVEQTDVNLLIMEANNLDTQRGVYIDNVVEDSPADQAGLQGSTGRTTVGDLNIPVPTGGDVVVAINGQSIIDSNQLLSEIAFSNPGDTIELTILRDGEEQQVTVTLEARPQNFDFGP